MTESAQISTSSTGGEEIPSELISQPQKIPINQCTYPRNYLSKRFKNLIDCFPCPVDDCQILFETQKELDIHKANMTNYINVNIQAVKKLLLNRLIYVNTINPTSKIEKFIFVPMKAAIKVSLLLTVLLCIIGFIQGINRSNVKFAGKNFLIKQIGNIMRIICTKKR